MTTHTMGFMSFPAMFHPAVEVIEKLEATGLVDQSWNQDAVPNWALFKGDGAEAVARIWIEPVDALWRSEGATHAYTAELLDEDGLTEMASLNTDDLSEALSFILV